MVWAHIRTSHGYKPTQSLSRIGNERIRYQDSKKQVQGIFENKQRPIWVVATLSMFLILHVRELDAGRNIFWRCYDNLV